MEFLDLKDYTPGDDITSIDWKCSSRTDSILVRRYIAEKKHSVLIIGDTGLKMDADTSAGDSKAEVALMTTGVISYLLGRQGADIAFACSDERGEVFSSFSAGGITAEKNIRLYGESLFKAPSIDMNTLVRNMVRTFPMRRMIIFVITDLAGLSTMKTETLLEMSGRNDVYFICVNDAPVIGKRVFDRVRENYMDGFLAGSRALKKAEKAERARILDTFKNDAVRNRVVFSEIARNADVVDSVINMFERGHSGIYG